MNVYRLEANLELMHRNGVFGRSLSVAARKTFLRQPFFFKNGRRPAGCSLPSSPTSRRCRDQSRSLMLRLRSELPSVRHTPRLSHARLRNSNPQANPLQRLTHLTTVSTETLPCPQPARAISYHSNLITTCFGQAQGLSPALLRTART